MKCCSVVAQRMFIPGEYTLPGQFIVVDIYPLPVSGIQIMRDQCAVDVGGKHVRVSRALLCLDESTGAIRRDYTTGIVTILRASISLAPDGDFELIPERETDRDGTLLFLDLSRGFCLGVRYEASPALIVARSVPRTCFWNSSEEEVMLVALKPDETVEAIRYIATGWLRWRKELPVERVTYRMEGENITFQPKVVAEVPG